MLSSSKSLTDRIESPIATWDCQAPAASLPVIATPGRRRSSPCEIRLTRARLDALLGLASQGS